MIDFLKRRSFGENFGCFKSSWKSNLPQNGGISDRTLKGVGVIWSIVWGCRHFFVFVFRCAELRRYFCERRVSFGAWSVDASPSNPGRCAPWDRSEGGVLRGCRSFSGSSVRPQTLLKQLLHKQLNLKEFAWLFFG
jgi:hypothetical protein